MTFIFYFFYAMLSHTTDAPIIYFYPTEHQSLSSTTKYFIFNDTLIELIIKSLKYIHILPNFKTRKNKLNSIKTVKVIIN